MPACTPHPGFGSVLVRHGTRTHVVDLATCRAHDLGPGTTVTVPAGIVATKRAIRVAGRTLYVAPRGSSVEVVGRTPDSEWVLFAVDPLSSASLAADGLTLRAVSVATHRVRTVASGLLYGDYRAWCGNRLVLTAGGDRLAGHHKWLLTTGPPAWRPRVLVRDARRAFGSLACDGDSVVVQSAPDGGSELNGRPRWSLWRVRLADGALRRLTSPPRGFSDDSPRVARDGTIVFVRSRNGRGTLWGLGVGPLLPVGRDDGYYGHRGWTSVSWSRQR